MTTHSSGRPAAPGRVRTVTAVLSIGAVLATTSCSTSPAPGLPIAAGQANAGPTEAGSAAAAPIAKATQAGAAPAAPVARALPRSRPVRLQIPAIGVDTALIDLGLQRDGTLQVPPDGTRAGWFTGAPSPGERGPAVMTGHVDWAGHEGVFYDLRHLQLGARITVTRRDGSTAVFGVTGTQQVPKGTFPTRAVYDDVDHPALRLITCGGSFDHTAHSYRDNIVVFADLLTTQAST